jgi:hypothetical protein
LATCGSQARSIAYLMSAVLTVLFCNGGLYLIPGRILIVSVFPPSEISGAPVARSGCRTFDVDFQAYSDRWVGCHSAM